MLDGTFCFVIPAKAGIQKDARFRGHPELDPVFQRGDGSGNFPQRPPQKLLNVSGTGNIMPILN